MIRSRLMMSAISLLVFTALLSGCLNMKQPDRWNNTDNKDHGITAKQGYISALDKINGTYTTPPISIFLTKVQSKGNDVTRFGKGTFWRFYFCIHNSTDQYTNLTVEIFSNGTKNLHEQILNVSNPPNRFIQNWTIDSDKAMGKGLERSDIKEYVDSNGIYVDHMDLNPYPGFCQWTIIWASQGFMDDPSHRTANILASE